MKDKLKEIQVLKKTNKATEYCSSKRVDWFNWEVFVTEKARDFMKGILSTSVQCFVLKKNTKSALVCQIRIQE